MKGNSKNKPKKSLNVEGLASKKSNKKRANTSQKQSNTNTGGNSGGRVRPGTVEGGGKGMKNLSLGSIIAVRKTMARMMKKFNKGELSAEKMRILTYSVTVLLQAFKAEVTQDLEERLTALEEKLS